MPQYIPPSWISRCAMPAVKGPALFIAHDRDDESFFITGGDDAQAIFVGGVHRGQSFRSAQGGNWTGLAIEGVTIEVDLASAANPMKSGVAVGSLARVGDRLFLYGSGKDSMGFTDVYAWDVNAGIGETYLSDAVAFTRWRLVKQHGEEVVELAAYDVTPTS